MKKKFLYKSKVYKLVVKLVQGLGQNSYRYPQKDLQILARYANGLEVQPKKEKITDGLEPMNLMSYPLTMSAFDGYQWLKDNKGNYKNAFNETVKDAKSAYNVMKKTGLKGVLRNVDAQNVLLNIPTDEFTKTLSKQTQNLYAQAQKYAQGATNTSGNVKNLLKKANQKLAEANAAAYSETASRGLLAGVKKSLGITAVNKGLNNLAVKSPTFSKCLDAYRNESGTMMLLLEGGMETAFNVVPTFRKLGAKRGFKQLGKSAVTTISSVAGWVAGSALGSKVGSIVKAATGNTKLGALVGVFADKACSYIGGSIAQNLTSKAAQKLVGKSEIEKAKDEETNALAEMAQTDNEVLQTLLEAANQRMEQEGTETEDYRLVQEACKNLIMSQQSSPMLNREQLAMVAQSLEDPQVQPQQQVAQQPQMQAQTPVSTLAQDSARAQRALKNSDAFMNKVSKNLLK